MSEEATRHGDGLARRAAELAEALLGKDATPAAAETIREALMVERAYAVADTRRAILECRGGLHGPN
jgi:hypothetical protein